MVAVTYGVARVSPTNGAARKQNAAPRKSLFTRFMDAVVEARLRQVHREISRHAHLLPYTLDERGNRLVKFNLDDIPFNGR